MNRIGQFFRKYDPDTPFEYHFTTDNYNQKFAEETYVGHISVLFCILTLFISCLGLFGLSSFIAEQRSKEIAVRKILGANIFNLWKLMSSGFVWLILLSSVIASPVVWYVLQRWLEQYEYRTTVSWWLFPVVGLGTIILALITISFQIVKATTSNPILSLRNE